MFAFEPFLVVSYEHTTNLDINLANSASDDLLDDHILHDILVLNALIRPFGHRFLNNEVVLVLLLVTNTVYFVIFSLGSKFIQLHEFKLIWVPEHLIVLIKDSW